MMRKKYLLSFGILLFSILCLSYSSNALAQSLTMRTSPRSMQGVRPLGMGGAFIAMDGTDENAIFYNPAAINDYEKKIHMQFLLPTVEFSFKAIPFFASDLTDLASDIDDAATNSDKIQVFQNFAAANTGRYEEIGIRGPLATFMHPWITASLFYENRSILGLLDPASTDIDLEATSQGGLQVGSSYAFWDKKLQVGGALKVVGRHLINEVIQQRDVVANDDFTDSLALKNFGVGIGVDLGAKFKFPLEGNKVWDYLDPTFALTLQDIGDTRFFIADNVGRIPQSVSFGFVLHPEYWKLKSNFAFDVRDLDHRTDFITKFFVGYEVIWPEISKILREVALRAGAHQGYISGGFGLDFKYFKMNAATYGREIGESTRQKQSRMFALQLAAGF